MSAELERALAALELPDDPSVSSLMRAARGRAQAIARVEGPAARSAAAAYVGDVLAGLATLREWERQEVEALLAALSAQTGTSEASLRMQVFREALWSPRLAELPPLPSIEAQLRLLTLFAPVSEASLWLPGPAGSPHCVAFRGKGGPTRRVRAAARETLAVPRRRAASARAFVHSMPVVRRDRARAALVIRARPGDRDAARAYTGEAALSISLAVERDRLLGRNAARESALVEASERRLTRLGFDIHDGALQDVVALADDLRLFGRQLACSLDQGGAGEVLLGRLDDFDARLVAIHDELRELAGSLERSSAVEKPLAEVLRTHVETFAEQNDIATRLEVGGNLAFLTASQRLALVALMREGLANVREHSRATILTVTVSAGREGTHASIVDNGRGFDVEPTLADAARRGRLGLVGMSERIRLLGGRLVLDSRPGGPTTITATIPRWQPPGETEQPQSPASLPQLYPNGRARLAAQPVVGAASAA